MHKLLLFLSILFFVSCENKKHKKPIHPKLTSINETVYASVQVIPAVTYYPQTIQAGIINKIYVEEGDKVVAGQNLFQISIPAILENNLSRAQLNLEEAKANYKGSNNLLLNIDLEIQNAIHQIKIDSVNFKRIERLWKQNIGKKNDYEKADLAYKYSKNHLNLLKQKRIQAQTSLENNYKKALSQSKSEATQISDFIIKSEINGVVYSLNKEVGDLISSAERFGEIGSVDSYTIQMDIDEVDIAKIEIKDSVIIILEAFPDETFIANVNRIFPKKIESTQTFRVEALFAPPVPKLYNGLSGEANILVEKKTEALVIPADYLISANKVLTPEGEISVKIGLKNLEFVEIIEGLNTHTEIIKEIE